MTEPKSEAQKPPRKAVIVVSSDRASKGTYGDESGPAAAAWLQTHGYLVTRTLLVPDDQAALIHAVETAVTEGADLVVTSGGTGLGSRDVTPQALDACCDYPVPGFGELLRRESLKYSLNAYLSRCGGWVKNRALVLALPGNPKAVTEQLDILSDLLPHALRSLDNACDHRRKTTEAHA